MSRTLTIILAVVVLLIVAGGCFYAGTVYARSQMQAVFVNGRQGGFGGQSSNPNNPDHFHVRRRSGPAESCHQPEQARR